MVLTEKKYRAKVVAIIQARMGSTRLPGKVMKNICGKTVLAHVVERVRASQGVGSIVIATTIKGPDNAVAEEAAHLDVKVFRGSQEDVLSRYYLAAVENKADIVVRVTSDCPLFDAHILDDMLHLFEQQELAGEPIDYLSNSLVRSFPLGLDAEIFTFAALERAYREATKDYEREHVTPYLYQHPEIFRVLNFPHVPDLSCYRWTLDTPEDFLVIKTIYETLGRDGKIFSTEAILQLMKERPELAALNAHVHQKELGE